MNKKLEAYRSLIISDDGAMSAFMKSPASELKKNAGKVITAKQGTAIKKFFAAGKVYRLIFGGGDAGTVKVNSWDLGCNNIHAKVTLNTSAKLGGKVMAGSPARSQVTRSPGRRSPHSRKPSRPP